MLCCAYRSTTPRPTRYPRLSRRWKTASRASSSSMAVVGPLVAGPPPLPLPPASPSPPRIMVPVDVAVEPFNHASSRAARSNAILYAMGTSSMRRKSRAERETRVDVGSVGVSVELL